jgi:hypothetical protein
VRAAQLMATKGLAARGPGGATRSPRVPCRRRFRRGWVPRFPGGDAAIRLSICESRCSHRMPVSATPVRAEGVFGAQEVPVVLVSSAAAASVAPPRHRDVLRDRRSHRGNQAASSPAGAPRDHRGRREPAAGLMSLAGHSCGEGFHVGGSWAILCRRSQFLFVLPHEDCACGTG